ncbi:MAG: putative protein [Legionellaceae bacterium]
MEKNPLIASLQNTALYDHPVSGFHVIETHVSWVILTGFYAYKIKKPVDFEFLNYSTLEKRYYYCQEEYRLNQRWAPDMYCGVIPIYGSKDAPSFMSDNHHPIEYAVKMREFPQSSLFSALLAKNALTLSLMDEVGHSIAAFHQCAQPALTGDFGKPEHVHAPVVQNFDQIQPLLTDPNDIAQLNNIRLWAEKQYENLYEVFEQRKAQGYIRECHGDIYLNNIILWEGKPTIFDCIEFNDDFRWTDVMADIGFLAMDLEDNQKPQLAHQLINAYFQTSGDYQGLMVLPYYQAYRAVVRAKVALFRLLSDNVHEQEKLKIQSSYRSYMSLAEKYTQTFQKAIMITHGFSGSGKSTLAKEVMHETSAIYISSDIERKRLNGISFTSDSHSAINKGLYHSDNTKKVYQHLLELAQIILNAGYPVIVDAAFLKEEQRNLFAALAKEKNIPFIILSCQGSVTFLKNNLSHRLAFKQDPSEATERVLDMQMIAQEPLAAEEKEKTLVLNTEDLTHFIEFLSRIKARINSFFTSKVGID